MTKGFYKVLALLLVWGLLSISRLSAVDNVAGTLFTLTSSSTAPNGAWSWFEDERAIIDTSDPENPVLLVSSVSSGVNGDAESGDIDLLWRNLNTGVQGEFELHDRLERDDHDSAGLYLRPDGRYLAMYSRHSSDNLTRWRVSTNPHDPTTWGPMQSLNNGVGTTYNNIHHLAGDSNGEGRTYNFTRSTGFDPVVQISSDDGSTWSNGGQLLTQGDGGDRPYVRYASDGKRIHLITTEEHPRDFANSVYHGYIEDGVLYNSSGSVIDGNLFDANGMAPAALTPVFENATQFGGTTMNRAWTISLELDNTGNPAGILTARANDDNNDHRFFYARYDGADWHVNEMARAGGFLYAAEADYTGLASVDPDNPNVVYMSSKIDPRTEATTGKYELYRGETTDFGATWSWSAVTENSTVDNLRPLVPAWNGQDSALVWMRGTYTTYTNWNTEVVGLRFVDSGPKALLWKGNAGTSGSWEVGIGENWDSGGGSFAPFTQGDEVAFDDSATSYNVVVLETVVPMGVAFNNVAMPYTITGAGISGDGGLRVIGGGHVTLNNASNVYSGETLIARGTLELVGDAALTATSRIDVKQHAVLDADGLTEGGLHLAGQHLVVDGTVTGNTHAVDDSTIIIRGEGSVGGDVTLNNSSLTGEGRIGGKLTANAGTMIKVGSGALTVAPSLGPAVYYDATSGPGGNTTLANGAIFNPPLNAITGADNAWEQRTLLGSHDNIFESGGEAVENAPQLRTTLVGLDPTKTYEVSVLFWDATGSVEDWNIRAGFEPIQLIFIANGSSSDAAELGATAATLASTLTYSVAPTLFTQANRVLLSGTIGLASPTANGQMQLYLDDMPSLIGANNRTWYDGIVLREIIPPAEQLVTLEVTGDFVQHANATLELEIYSPRILDRLNVTGGFVAGGTLVVALADGAPAPSLGDSFQIISAEAFQGAFVEFDLPVLAEGLAWNLSEFTERGALDVVRDVDLDNDGDVDGLDFLLIQRTSPELIGDWQLLYGDRLIAFDSGVTLAVPEPHSHAMVWVATMTSLMARLRLAMGI